ncbi:MAG TPA: hypothetical protein VM260_16050, partial [Pirellula sp.]|nr:hypothetical protein [Pirellula sp.]
RHSTGQEHVYQGRFKSFPIQDDQHLKSSPVSAWKAPFALMEDQESHKTVPDTFDFAQVVGEVGLALH